MIQPLTNKTNFVNKKNKRKRQTLRQKLTERTGNKFYIQAKTKEEK
jgi:hypothetical protein